MMSIPAHRFNSHADVAHHLIDLIFNHLLPNYGMIIRDAQVELAHRMLDILIGHQIALHEAGVGIGKTFSYLVAAIAYQQCMPDDWWIRHNYPFSNGFQSHTPMPFVISTSSIALQQAIMADYIPFLSNILMENNIIQKPLRTVIRKGKGNYVCEKRLRQHLAEKNTKTQNSRQREALLGLRQGTVDLDQVAHLSSYDRKRVCVNNTCGNQCPDRFNCRYFRYMLDVRSPEILFQICNHNYLLADQIHRSTSKEPLLPNFKGLIIDEAHKLAEAAQQMYGIALTQADVAGLVESATNQTVNSKEDLIRLKRLAEINHRLFAQLAILAKSDSPDREEGSQSIAFQPDSKTLSLMQTIITSLTQIADRLDNQSNHKLQNQFHEKIDRVNLFLYRKQAFIYQLVTNERTETTSLVATPYDVSEQLAAGLWSSRIPAILTSGTLAIRGDYSRTRQVLGLDAIQSTRQIDEFFVASPFDYQRNCLLYLPKTLPTPTDDSDEYILAIADHVAALIQAAHGHTLVLFNSYRLMSKIREIIDPVSFPCPLIVANKDVQLTISQFKALPNAVLFATGACWEGIDFAGDVVSSLIIVSLPFSVPDQVKLHEQKQYANLRDYIMAVVVPAMQQKLKQGFGRAIRTETDTCVVSILDPRALWGARYHWQALAALPECPVTSQLEDVSHFIHLVKSPQYFY